MIDTALDYVKDRLNQHFKNEFSISENKVVLSNILNVDGTVAEKVDGKIVFFLISLDEESLLKNSLNRSIASGSDSFARKPPPLHLNMQVMFCANFTDKNYVEGLSYLSSLIRFLQANKRMVPPPSKEENSTTERLTFDLCKLDFSEMSHLWSAIGSKLMPSVVYKVGMMIFDEAPVTKLVTPIKETESHAGK